MRYIKMFESFYSKIGLDTEVDRYKFYLETDLVQISKSEFEKITEFLAKKGIDNQTDSPSSKRYWNFRTISVKRTARGYVPIEPVKTLIITLGSKRIHLEKTDDEYYIASLYRGLATEDGVSYKIDQIDGLLKFLNDFIK